MTIRKIKPFMFSLALLMIAAALTIDRGRAAVTAPSVEDTPELPNPDGSGDTPEIEVTMIDGKKVKLSSLRGKVCVLDIFASWCPHCQDHAPQMVKIYNQFKAQGLVMISLAADPKEKIDDVKKFIKDYGLNYPVGFLNNEVRAYYEDPRNHSVPQVIFFGKNGKMAGRWVGWSEERTQELSNLLQAELGTSAPSSTASEAKPQTAKTTEAKTAAVKSSAPRKK